MLWINQLRLGRWPRAAQPDRIGSIKSRHSLLGGRSIGDSAMQSSLGTALSVRIARTAFAAAAVMAFVACADEPSKTKSPLVSLAIRYHVVPGRVAIHEDPAHPIRIPYELYPWESMRLREEGSCMVRLTVGIDGNVAREEISVSSGSPRLDQACLDAYRSMHFLPAKENGSPVVDTVEMPVNWRLGHHRFY